MGSGRAARAVVVGVLFFSPLSSARASSIEFVGDPIQIIVSGQSRVPIYNEARVRVGDSETSIPVYLTGAGIYRKKIVFFDEDIYVASSYLDTPEPISSSDPLGSVFKSKVKVMYLTILRDLTPLQIRSHFEEGLDGNNVSLEDPAVQALLDEIDFPLLKADSALLIGDSGGALQRLHATVPDKEFYSENLSLADDFWRIWFGISVDNGFANLKANLIGK